MAKISSANNIPRRKMRETGKIGIPFRKDDKKGVEYQSAREAIIHPITAPATA